MENKSFIAHLSGMVQGVGFRYYVYKTAHKYGEIHGFVENLSDGRVKIVAEGPEEELKQFLAAVRSGPSTARVEDMDIEWKSFENKFDRFFIESGMGY